MLRKSIRIQGIAEQVTIDYPDECPICHHFGEIGTSLAEYVGQPAEMQVVFQCAFSGCKSFFIGYYGSRLGREPHTLGSLSPVKPKPAVFPEVVEKISPTFVSIHREAEEARYLGLTQIAGPGYRKALEFLVKDYAKSLTTDAGAQKNIEKAFLASVVKDHIPDSRIQKVANRALWLGNDETHYIRKWEAHDIKDLIALIRLTADWIEIEQESKKYGDSMPG